MVKTPFVSVKMGLIELVVCIPVLAAVFAPNALCSCTSLDSGKTSPIVDLFIAENYGGIIELCSNHGSALEWEKVILAKSYEKLGLNHEAYEILRDLYYSDGYLRDYAAYRIALLLEKGADASTALRWYKNVLSVPSGRVDSFGGYVDSKIMAEAALSRLKDIEIS